MSSLSTAWDAMAYDFVQNSQLPANANTHAMLEVDQSVSAGQAGTQSFIDNQVRVGNLGVASHTTQDKYSPSHQDEVWQGFGNMSVLEIAAHIYKHVVPGFSNISGAFTETKNMLSGSSNQTSTTSQTDTPRK